MPSSSRADAATYGETSKSGCHVREPIKGSNVPIMKKPAAAQRVLVTKDFSDFYLALRRVRLLRRGGPHFFCSRSFRAWRTRSAVTSLISSATSASVATCGANGFPNSLFTSSANSPMALISAADWARDFLVTPKLASLLALSAADLRSMCRSDRGHRKGSSVPPPPH